MSHSLGPLVLLTIPYVARWTFGEQIAAISEMPSGNGIRTASTSVSFALETLSAVLANGFRSIDQPWTNRDDIVFSARIGARERDRHRQPNRRIRVFISVSDLDMAVARYLAIVIEAAGFDVSSPNGKALVGDRIKAATRELENADALVVIIGDTVQSHPTIGFEIGFFFKAGTNSKNYRPILPVLIRKSAEQRLPELPTVLTTYNSFVLNLDKSISKQTAPLVSQLNAIRRPVEQS